MDERRLLCVTLGEADPALRDGLRDAGWTVCPAAGFGAAGRALAAQPADVGLLLCGAPDERLCAEIDAFVDRHHALEWVGVFTRESLALPACRELIVDRLFDHHTAPVDLSRLVLALGHAHGHAALRAAMPVAAHRPGAEPLVGRSLAMQRLLRQVRRVAKVDAPVLVSGESGSGKELTAQSIHRLSARAGGPFVAINCAALPPSLIQSELFGHEKGSFSGATRDKRGLIEAAGGGTVFLDEIGDLSLELQTNLLRFLQEKTINRVGSTRSIHVEVRVLAATHVDLEAAVARGAFREDLFYRLNVLPLAVPPLRERRDDIEMLAQHFFVQFERERSPRLKGFSRRALLAMQAHAWPGNVRELMNRVRRALVMAEGRLVAPHDLGLAPRVDPAPVQALIDARTLAEKSAIAIGLRHAGENVSQTARNLGVSRMTLYRLMSKHGIGS